VVAELARLNEYVETKLEAMRLNLLSRLGPPPPHDLPVMFRQVTADDMARLGR
jgi:hypothetical protein